MQTLADLLAELKRRRVFRVAIVYAGVAFIIFQIVDATFDYLPIPDWVGTTLIVVLLLGFPIAVGLAWAFDITEQGVVKTPPKEEPAEAKKVPHIVIGNKTLAIVAVLAIAVAVWSWWGRPDKEAALGAKSIAVLPFVNFSDSKDDEYFSDGITDDILTHLSKIGDLKVIARTSVMQYKNTEKRIRDIGRELGVATLLEGSVRRADSRVRVTSQLVDAETEEHLWAETYDRDLTDIFAIQSDVASKIAAALKATLVPGEKSTIERRPTKNLEAYDYYLKGNYFWNNYATLEGNEKAVEMYEKAVALDPEFALAYAKLAITHVVLYGSMDWDHTPERLEKGKATLDKALELSPDLPEVYEAMGTYYDWGLRDYDRALEQYEIALQKQPNNSEIIWSIGRIYAYQGKLDQAGKYFLRAYELDPQDLNNALGVAWLYRFQRNWSEAERWINIAVSTNPEYHSLYSGKARIHVYGYGNLDKGREVIEEGLRHVEPHLLTAVRWELEMLSGNYQEALAVLESDTTDPRHLNKGHTFYLLGEEDQARAYYDSVRVKYESLVQGEPDNDFYHSSLGRAYAGLGRKDAAIREGKRAVELYRKSTGASGGSERLRELAFIYILVGEYDQAIVELEHLLSIPSSLTRWRLKLDPIYDPLRELPRFQALVEKSGKR